jgi:hypothetical protein
VEKGKVKIPTRFPRNSRGLLFLRLGEEISLRFGDIYEFKYSPRGARLPYNQQINKLPFYDRNPLIIFLEYHPADKTIMGINLHLLDPVYRNDMILLIKYIKEYLHLLVEEEGKKLEPEDEFHINDIFGKDDMIDSIEDAEKEITDENLDEKILSSSENLLKGKKAIDWSLISEINNPMTNMIPICLRTYTVQRLKDIEDFYKLDDEHKEKLIESTPNLYGKLKWKLVDIKKVSTLSRQKKNWRNYIRKKIEKQKKK